MWGFFHLGPLLHNSINTALGSACHLLVSPLLARQSSGCPTDWDLTSCQPREGQAHSMWVAGGVFPSHCLPEGEVRSQKQELPPPDLFSVRQCNTRITPCLIPSVCRLQLAVPETHHHPHGCLRSNFPFPASHLSCWYHHQGGPTLVSECHLKLPGRSELPLPHLSHNHPLLSL